jgi:hypothetical protein
MTNETYEQIGQQVGQLVDEKNAAYGSSFAESHKILSVLYPNGISPEQYTDALAIIRVIDKLFRIATSKDAFGETPWQDIAGYAILGVANAGNRREETEGDEDTREEEEPQELFGNKKAKRSKKK